MLEYLGRTDHQVKIRGLRIELGEIEAVLAGHPAVLAAVVLVREDQPGDRRLVAYPVVGSSTPVTADELRDHLAARLPDYLVPHAYVLLDALPVTPAGKVDTRALPAPPTAATTGRAPRTPQEEILCGLFGELLGLPTVGVDDNFFAIGGHSLLAVRLINRVREALGSELDVRDIFLTPTPAGLVGQLGRVGGRTRPALAPQARPERLPLSHAQQRLWFLHQIEPSSALHDGDGPAAARYLAPGRAPGRAARRGRTARVAAHRVPGARRRTGAGRARRRRRRTGVDRDGLRRRGTRRHDHGRRRSRVRPGDRPAAARRRADLGPRRPRAASSSCTTSRPTAGRWGRCSATSPRRTRPGSPATRRSGNRCRCSTRDYTLWQRDLLGDAGRPGQRLRRTARLLAHPAGRPARPARTADRPAAPGGADLPGRCRRGATAAGAARRDGRDRPRPTRSRSTWCCRRPSRRC